MPMSNSAPDRLTKETADLLDRALREALQLGHSFIGPEHLLFAIIKSPVGDVLRSRGIDTAKIRQAILQHLIDERPQPPVTVRDV